MPIQYKTFGCSFKCGKKHGDWASICHHETICWKNPDNETCITCVYGHIEYEGDERFRYCSIDDDMEFEQTKSTKEKIIPKMNCPMWWDGKRR